MEKAKEIKKLDKLDKYVIYPNTHFYGGYTYDGKDIELCDDSDSMVNEKGKEVFTINVKQKILKGILYTDIHSTKTYKDGTKQFDTVHQELQLKKGQLLVYVENQGFVIPEYKMVTIDRAKEIYDIIGGRKNDSGTNKG